MLRLSASSRTQKNDVRMAAHGLIGTQADFIFDATLVIDHIPPGQRSHIANPHALKVG